MHAHAIWYRAAKFGSTSQYRMGWLLHVDFRRPWDPIWWGGSRECTQHFIYIFYLSSISSVWTQLMSPYNTTLAMEKLRLTEGGMFYRSSQRIQGGRTQGQAVLLQAMVPVVFRPERTAWPHVPPLISFDCFYRTFLPSVNLNFSVFIIDP